MQAKKIMEKIILVGMNLSFPKVNLNKMFAFWLRKKIFKCVIAQNCMRTLKTLEVTDMCRLRKRTRKQSNSGRSVIYLTEKLFIISLL